MLVRVRQGKVCQSALRHKVRNLRAKVKLLLPTQLCAKDRRRAKNIGKMMRNRGEGQQWFIPAPGRRERHMFQRLSKQQIEQIKQDKLYYVGQQFIDQFNRFLQKQHGVKQWTGRLATANSSIPQIPNVNINYTPLFHKTTSSNFSSLLRQEETYPCFQEDKENRKINTSVKDRKMKNLLRFQSIKEKRKIIREQQLTRKAAIRYRMEEREKRREENWQKVNAKRDKSIRQRNQMNMVRTSASFRVRKSREGMGQINQLSQKLRGLCLQKGYKSTQIMS